MAPRYHFPQCALCGEIPLAEHRQVWGGCDSVPQVKCNDHVEVSTLSSPRPRYLPAVPVQSGRYYVEWDEDLAAIGVIEPVFVEEERWELVPERLPPAGYLPPGKQRWPDPQFLRTDTRIVTVPVLRWQKVVEARPDPESPDWARTLSEPIDWWGVFFVVLLLAFIFGPAISLLL